jgi:hypothetical protein
MKLGVNYLELVSLCWTCAFAAGSIAGVRVYSSETYVEESERRRRIVECAYVVKVRKCLEAEVIKFRTGF